MKRRKAVGSSGGRCKKSGSRTSADAAVERAVTKQAASEMSDALVGSTGAHGVFVVAGTVP